MNEPPHTCAVENGCKACDAMMDRWERQARRRAADATAMTDTKLREAVRGFLEMWDKPHVGNPHFEIAALRAALDEPPEQDSPDFTHPCTTELAARGYKRVNRAPEQAPGPVCTQCNDTHMMPWQEDVDGNYERKVMCTRCPVPCQKCRAGGNGAFCGETPCACNCHGEQQAPEPAEGQP